MEEDVDYETLGGEEEESFVAETSPTDIAIPVPRRLSFSTPEFGYQTPEFGYQTPQRPINPDVTSWIYRDIDRDLGLCFTSNLDGRA